MPPSAGAYRRFGAVLMDGDARLGADMDRYSFGCRLHENQGLTQSASNPKLITHLADFSVQEVNFEHIF